MRVHLRRRETKLSGQILAAQRFAAAPVTSFVATPLRCPASLSSLLLAFAPAALATRPMRLLPRAARRFVGVLRLWRQASRPGTLPHRNAKPSE